MKVVYVLTSPKRNRFTTMTFLSVSSLRRVQPDVHPVLITDCLSFAVLQSEFPELLTCFETVKQIETDIKDIRIRSRLLKSRMREVIEGDFVYLDIDTLPVRRFDELWAGDWDVAAVQDRNHHCPITPIFPHWRKDDYQQLGWKYPLPQFFNSGVLFLRDNERTRALNTEWQKRWKELYAVGREDDDQFAFTSALFEISGLKVHEADTRYNAVVRVHPVHAKNAKIYHFYAGNTEGLGDSLYEHLINMFDRTGHVDWMEIDRAVASDHPWMPPYWPRRLWQTGNRWQAITTAIGNYTRRYFTRPTRNLTSG